MSATVAGLVTVVGFILLGAGPQGDPGESTTEVAASMLGVNVTKRQPGSESLKQTRPLGTSVSYTQRKYEPHCTHDRQSEGDGPECMPCEVGDRHSLQERKIENGIAVTSWETVAFVCLTPEEAGSVTEQITPAMVLDAMRGLEWDKPELSVQPPGGRTLVNAKTFAFADDPGARVQRVTLLGEQIDVEGTPASWTWHWGDGAVDVTEHPGSAAPDGSVWHRYERAREGVRVRVDVTYTGRYRRPGGEWQPTAEGVTVRGDAQELSVHEAVVQLVR